MSMEKFVQEICEQKGFNGNVLIAKGRDVLLCSSFGYKDIAAKAPMNKDVVFRIGSITKQVTAVAILQLVQNGKLNLSDTIDSLIDGVTYDHPITIHHLLANSSGIGNFDVFGDYSKQLASERFYETMVEDVILKQPLHFVPGERFEYSSSGFFLLTTIIEKISGLPYHEYLQKNLFDVLGMTHTGFHFPTLSIPEFSALYDLKDGVVVEAPFYDMRKAGGAGGLYSTIEDLYRWNRGLIECTILDEPFLDEMFAVQTPINETGGYGYGVVSVHFEKDGEQHQSVYHPGNGPGVFAQNMMIDKDIQINMISNINDGKTFRGCFDAILEYVQKHLV